MEHVKALESHLIGKTSGSGEAGLESSIRTSGRPILEDNCHDGTDLPQEPPVPQPCFIPGSSAETLVAQSTAISLQKCAELSPSHGTVCSDLRQMRLDFQTQSQPSVNLSAGLTRSDLFTQQRVHAVVVAF